MHNFEKINASWIAYNALCDPDELGDLAGEEEVKNLQETHLEVYSANKCSEKFPNMQVLTIGEVDMNMNIKIHIQIASKQRSILRMYFLDIAMKIM